MKYLMSLIVLLSLVACGQPSASISSPNPNPPQYLPLPASNQPEVTIVQFCPGATNYPTSFPEVGLCIQGNIYAVYSANDGFLTLIPPGQYDSNAIGSSCSFTVYENCGITAPQAN